MARAKKKRPAKAKAKRRKLPAATAPAQPAEVPQAPAPMRVLRELWCKIGQPIRVEFLDKMRADTMPPNGGRKRPAMLARVRDLSVLEVTGDERDLAIPASLAAIFAAVPKDGYVARKYEITRHRKHERVNAAGFSVQEIL